MLSRCQQTAVRSKSIATWLRKSLLRQQAKTADHHFKQWLSTSARAASSASLSSGSLKRSYVHGLSNIGLLGNTIGERFDYAAETWPDRESHVILHQNIRFTFASLRQKAEQLASGLLSLGLKPGDRVGVWAPNCSEWILAQYGTAVAGLIQVNVNPAYRADELGFVLRKVGCQALIMSESFRGEDCLSILRRVTPELDHCPAGDLKSGHLPDLKHVIMIGKKQKGTWSFDEVMSAGDSASTKLLADAKKQIEFDDAVNIQFTSGTTGHPKGATLTHHNLLNNVLFMNRGLRYHEEVTRICVPVSLYHCFGMVMGSLSTILDGATCVLPTAIFNAEEAVKAAQQEKCTSIYGTPTMFVDMLRFSQKYDLKSLRTGIMAGAPCPQELYRRTVKEMHTPELIIVYGMTETSPVTLLHDIKEPLDERITTVGYAMPHVEIKIVDSDGHVVPVNTPGELWARGYVVMRGYWNDAERTREAITEDRWMRTGDIATMDERGQGRIVGRLKDMIIRGGENIYPREIEEVLHTHPSILDAYVFGIPDERLGEEACVWAMLRPGKTLTAKELQSFCKEHLAYFKVPKHVRFVSEFPMTVTGKVQKFRMRDLMVDMMKKEQKS